MAKERTKCLIDEDGLLKIALYKKDGSIVDYAIVDPWWKEEVEKYSWYCSKGYPVGCRNKEGIKEEIRLHRLVMNPQPNEVVIHLNNHLMNCRESNLRVSSRKNIPQNKAKAKNAKSKYIGVCKIGNKWKAHCQFNGKTIHLGVFEKEEDGAYCYDEFIREHYGELGKLNGLTKPENYKAPIIARKSLNPNNIYYDTSTKSFRVKLVYKNKNYGGRCKTKEEAQAKFEEIKEEIKKMKLIEEESLSQQPIPRNENGIAYRLVKSKGTTVQVLMDDDTYKQTLNKNMVLSSHGYPAVRIDGKLIPLHRFALKAESNQIVDHISGNILDATLKNLRIVNASVNSHNRKPKNRYRGVSKQGKKLFRAQIKKDKKRYECGGYETEELAAHSYNFMAKKLYKENAVLNELPPLTEDYEWDDIKERLVKRQKIEHIVAE